jgi:hypothetical protein
MWSPSNDGVGSSSVATPADLLRGETDCAARVAPRARGCCGSGRVLRGSMNRRRVACGTALVSAHRRSASAVAERRDRPRHPVAITAWLGSFAIRAETAGKANASGEGRKLRVGGGRVGGEPRQLPGLVASSSSRARADARARATTACLAPATVRGRVRSQPHR